MAEFKSQLCQLEDVVTDVLDLRDQLNVSELSDVLAAARRGQT